MANVEFCEHDWPGSGCAECRAARSDILVEANSVCRVTIGSTVHTLRVFLRVKEEITRTAAAAELASWLQGKELDDIYRSLKTKIERGNLSTFQSEMPWNWYRDGVFVAWLLETGRAVDAMADRESSDEHLMASCTKGDDGVWVAAVWRFGERPVISAYADGDPDSKRARLMTSA